MRLENAINSDSYTGKYTSTAKAPLLPTIMHLTHILTVLAVISLAVARPITVNSSETATLELRETAIQATDRLLFDTSMYIFLDKKRLRNPSTLDWSDNGCTIVPDRPNGFNFLTACQRHDFGYRNYKHQGRCGESNKLKIDLNFREDMISICSVVSPQDKKNLCLANAETFYTGVRTLGAWAFC